MAYIKVAFSHEYPIKFVPIEKDGRISMETLNSIFLRARGMFYEHKNNQYVITLTNGRLQPPPDGWKNSVFFPLFGDEDDYESDDGGYEEDDYYGDNDYYEDDHHEDDRKNDVYGKPPIEEDINELFYKVLNDNGDNDYDDNGYDEDDYDDDD